METLILFLIFIANNPVLTGIQMTQIHRIRAL